MLGRIRLWKFYFIVFMASACTLVLEFVAGRMMAPMVGVSLYTWTSIIGVVLAGISIGNYLGGRIADQGPLPADPGHPVSARGLEQPQHPGADRLPSAPGWTFRSRSWRRSSLLTMILFFLPSALFGTISPIVVKLALKSLDTTGSTVGKIYAWSTVGSIVGTFATGFVLISWFGTRAIVAGVAVTAILMGLVFGELWRRERAVTATDLVIFLGFGFYLNTGRCLRLPILEGEQLLLHSFHRPRSTITRRRRGTFGRCVLDHLVHSFVDMDDPTYLEYGYEKVYADIVEYMSQSRPALNTLFIGGGGYTFPRYMEHVYPTSNLEVIEIDPEVTRAAYEELGLPKRQQDRHPQHRRADILQQGSGDTGQVRPYHGGRLQRPVSALPPDNSGVPREADRDHEAGWLLHGQHHRQPLEGRLHAPVCQHAEGSVPPRNHSRDGARAGDRPRQNTLIVVASRVPTRSRGLQGEAHGAAERGVSRD